MSDPRSDPAMKAALDRFDVPPLPADFTARVIAASAVRPAPIRLPWRRRQGWRGRAIIVGGGVALGLLSAAAAATGYFGEQARSVVREAPVLGPIIAQVAPAPKPVAAKPEPVLAAKPRPAPSVPEDAVETPAPRRSEIIAQTIVKRLEARAQIRRELGLPPQPVRRRQIVRALMRLPPEERREVVQNLREIRRERIAERWRMRQERRARWEARADPEAPLEPFDHAETLPPVEN